MFSNVIDILTYVQKKARAPFDKDARIFHAYASDVLHIKLSNEETYEGTVILIFFNVIERLKRRYLFSHIIPTYLFGAENNG